MHPTANGADAGRAGVDRDDAAHDVPAPSGAGCARRAAASAKVGRLRFGVAARTAAAVPGADVIRSGGRAAGGHLPSRRSRRAGPRTRTGAGRRVKNPVLNKNSHRSVQHGEVERARPRAADAGACRETPSPASTPATGSFDSMRVWSRCAMRSSRAERRRSAAGSSGGGGPGSASSGSGEGVGAGSGVGGPSNVTPADTDSRQDRPKRGGNHAYRNADRRGRLPGTERGDPGGGPQRRRRLRPQRSSGTATVGGG